MKIKLLVLVFLTCFTAIYGEYFQEPEGLWLLDLPEGFILREVSPDGKRFLFSGETVPLDVIAMVSDETGNSSQEFTNILKKLNNTGHKTEIFKWDGLECCFGEVFFPVNSGNQNDAFYKGFGITVPLEGVNGFFTVLTYGESFWADEYFDFMYSILDSVCVMDKHLIFPGPITTKDYSLDKFETANIELNGKKISYKVPEKSAEANQKLIEREFRILKTYAGSFFQNKAWERYYRIIYKDSFYRISDAGFKIGNALRFQEDKISSDYEFSKKLLDFIQNFKYERDKTESDFINIPYALSDFMGDCDTRSVLYLIILHQNNIDGIMMLSKVFSHSLIAVDVPGNGARFPFRNKKYLVGETTSKVDLGMIDSKQSEIYAWMGISFPGML